MIRRYSIEPFVAVSKRGNAIGLNVELENLSLTRKVQALLTEPAMSLEKRASLSGDRIERLFGRPQYQVRH
ncbi:MAG: hypothetical protein U0136_00070 [Bdellovibrionota bacterium]